MPTHAQTERFRRDYELLMERQQATFKVAVRKFVADLRTGTFRAGLRVKGIQGAPGIFEMSWAPDGRATFQYGDSIVEGEQHIIWRRIGTHAIFGAP